MDPSGLCEPGDTVPLGPISGWLTAKAEAARNAGGFLGAIGHMAYGTAVGPAALLDTVYPRAVPQAAFNAYAQAERVAATSSSPVDRAMANAAMGAAVYGGARAALPSTRSMSSAARAAGTAPVRTAEENYGVRFFGEEQVRHYTGASPMLGKPGSPVFFSPVEDMAVVRNAGDAALHSGMAPSVTNACVNGKDVFGISFPTTGLSTRLPTAADAGGHIHFLEGGHTAVRLPGGGRYLVNPTREFVTPGVAVPQGSVLFKLGPNGEWIIRKRF